MFYSLWGRVFLITPYSFSHWPAMTIVITVKVINFLLLVCLLHAFRFATVPGFLQSSSKFHVILLFATREWMVSPASRLSLRWVGEFIKIKDTPHSSQFPGQSGMIHVATMDGGIRNKIGKIRWGWIGVRGPMLTPPDFPAQLLKKMSGWVV